MGAQSNASGNNDALDRQMLRHLMARYSEQELARLILEERASPATHNDAASVMTSSTYSSVKSEDAPSMFDAASIRTFSTDNSSTRGSIISNVSARTAKLLGRRQHPNRGVTSVPSIEHGEWDDNDTTNGDTASISSASKQKGSFMCAFCKEENIQKTCTRKNDLKRHIEDFHNMNAQWTCKVRGCNMVFDWQTAYKTHLKQAHQGSRSSVDEAKVDLCPQTVFACGFEHCLQVFEASSDADAGSTFKDYVGHVVKHFDEGANSGEWTYSARIRNLLRQSGVMRAWNNSVPEPERSKLDWHPQSSVILRRRLETRHIGDLQLLIHYAMALGRDAANPPQFRDDFKMPVRHECTMPIQGHKNRLHGAPVSAPEPEFQFKISRASDPTMSAYLASQRKIVAPRAPVRSGRSARPPTMTMSRQSASHMNMPQYGHFHGTPSSSMFPPQQMHQHHQPQHHQPFAMMSAPEEGGGIIADDLRNLRSMADTIPGNDIEMGDSNMMDASYMGASPDFNGGYSQALQSEDGSLSGHQQHAFGAYDGSTPY
jgi:hypothetical protein